MNKSYFSFSSQSGRLEYFITQLILAISATVISAISGLEDQYTINDPYYSAPISVDGAIFVLILLFILLYLSILSTCKRLNDLGKSPWLALLSLIPIVNLVFGLYLLFMPGIKANQTQNFLNGANLNESRLSTMDDSGVTNSDNSPVQANGNNRLVDNLERLATLRNKGLITDEEFKTLKTQLLEK